MPNYDRLFTLDEPVPYKNIKLFPVKVRDHDTFYRLFDFREKKYSRHQDIKNVILGIFISSTHRE